MCFGLPLVLPTPELSAELLMPLWREREREAERGKTANVHACHRGSERVRAKRPRMRAVKEIGAFLLNPTRINNTR